MEKGKQKTSWPCRR